MWSLYEHRSLLPPISLKPSSLPFIFLQPFIFFLIPLQPFFLCHFASKPLCKPLVCVFKWQRHDFANISGVTVQYSTLADLSRRGWLVKEWRTSIASVLCHSGLSLSRNLTNIERNISHCVICVRGGRRDQLCERDTREVGSRKSHTQLYNKHSSIIMVVW